MLRRFLSSMGILLASSLLAQFPLDTQRQEQALFTGQIQIGPGKQWYITFTTQSNYRNARIAGNIQAQGGSGNDIRVLVTKGQSVVYDSGRRRSVVLSVECSEPGQYALIFDNSFSLVSAKAVYGRVSLVHWGVDVARNVADHREARARYEQASKIVRRLYDALKADEHFWGTSQLAGIPSIRLINNRTINAAASWASNAIFVNRGLFDFADRTGKAEDVLAAVLGHELGHIFYRHPGYGSGQGVKGFFDELIGVTALDRVQEQEADVLGTRVSCQAGFDPTGVILVMLRFAAEEQSASSFMKNHPAGIERLRYLEGEVNKCQAWRSRTQTSPSSETDALQPTPPNGPTSATGGQAVIASNETGQSPPGEKLWRLVQDPNARWRFKIGDSFIFGERIMPEERRNLGDYDTLDVKKQGEVYIGKQRVRMTFKVQDSSVEGFAYRMCQWDFAVELVSVTPDRIEGRWEGYPRDSKLNVRTCERSGSRIWEEAAWIIE